MPSSTLPLEMLDEPSPPQQAHFRSTERLSCRVRVSHPQVPLLPAIGFIAGPLLVALFVPHFDFGAHPVTSMLAVATTLLAGYGVASSVIGKGRPIRGAVCAFFLVWYGLAVLAQIGLDHYPLIDNFGLWRPENDSGITAMAIALTSLVAFLCGSSLNSAASPPREPSVSKHATLIVFGALLATALGVAMLGSPGLLFQSRATLGQAFGDGEAGFSLAKALLRYPAVAAAYGYLMIRKITRPSRSLRLAGRLSVVAALIVANPISAPRFWSLTVYAALGMLALKDHNRSRVLRALPLLLVVSTLVVLPYADTFRRSLDGTIQLRSPTELMSTKGDFSSYSHTLLATSYVDSHGFRFGRQLLATSLFFVPRSAWHGKPTNTAVVVARDAGAPAHLNPASPLPAELYVDFGWPGVVIGFGLLGYFAQRIDRSLRHRGSWGWHLAPLLGVYAIYLLRGSLTSSVPPLVVTLVGMRLMFMTQRRASEVRRDDDHAVRTIATSARVVAIEGRSASPTSAAVDAAISASA